MKLLRFYFDWACSAPNNLSAFCFLAGGFLSFIFVLNGKFADMKELLAPFVALSPFRSDMREMPYADLQSQYDSGNRAGNVYWSRSTFFKKDEIGDQALQHILDHALSSQVMPTTIEIMHLGGAFADVPKTESAFYHRDANFELHTITTFPEKFSDDVFKKVSEWTSNFTNKLQPFGLNNGGYVNIGMEGQVPSAFSENYTRLQQLKGKYDPNNVFHLNHNIKPV